MYCSKAWNWKNIECRRSEIHIGISNDENKHNAILDKERLDGLGMKLGEERSAKV